MMLVNIAKPSKNKLYKESHQSKITIIQNISPKLWITVDEVGHALAHKIDKGIFSFDLDS